MPTKEELLNNLRAEIVETAGEVARVHKLVDQVLERLWRVDPETQSTADFMKNPQSLADHRNRILVSANHLRSLEERLLSVREALTKK